MDKIEIVVIALAAVLTVVSVYLVITLNKLKALIEKVDKLVAQNSNGITSIVDNVDEITDETKKTLSVVSKAVNGEAQGKSASLGNGAGENTVYDNIKTVLSIAGFAYGAYKYLRERSKNKKINKIYKEMKRSK